MGASKGGFTVKRVTLQANGYSYDTFRVAGRSVGRRIRKDFKSKEEAEGEKDRLEIEAANADGSIRPVNTRLTPAQVAQTEAAFLRLGDRSITFAVDWFLDNYRPPTVEKLLTDAVTTFRTAKDADVCSHVQNDYRVLLTALQNFFTKRHVHTLTTEKLESFMATRGKSKKTWNNVRGLLECVQRRITPAPKDAEAQFPILERACRQFADLCHRLESQEAA